MRCTYCRPGFDRGQDAVSLGAADFAFLVGHLQAGGGLRKVRITGGEPTTRRDVFEIVEAVSGVAGVGEVVMTTNGLTLVRDAARLRAAGLDRVNVSLDTLDRGRFEALTGVDGLDRVLAGLDAAAAAGFSEVKLNTVVAAGENVEDLAGLVSFAADRCLTLRLIELMPMGPIAERWSERYVPASAMRRALSGLVSGWLEPAGGGPDAARVWTAELVDGRRASVGFITPMSDHFCDDCDRLRITATGGVYPCLMDAERGNVLEAVVARDGAALDAALERAYAEKAAVHPAVAPGVMTHLGG